MCVVTEREYVCVRGEKDRERECVCVYVVKKTERESVCVCLERQSLCVVRKCVCVVVIVHVVVFYRDTPSTTGLLDPLATNTAIICASPL